MAGAMMLGVTMLGSPASAAARDSNWVWESPLH